MKNVTNENVFDFDCNLDKTTVPTAPELAFDKINLKILGFVAYYFLSL